MSIVETRLFPPFFDEFRRNRRGVPIGAMLEQFTRYLMYFNHRNILLSFRTLFVLGRRYQHLFGLVAAAGPSDRTFTSDHRYLHGSLTTYPVPDFCFSSEKQMTTDDCQS